MINNEYFFQEMKMNFPHPPNQFYDFRQGYGTKGFVTSQKSGQPVDYGLVPQ